MMAMPPAKQKPLPPGRRALLMPRRKGIAFFMVAIPGVACMALGALIGWVMGAQATALWMAAALCGTLGVMIGVRTLVRVLSYDSRYRA